MEIVTEMLRKCVEENAHSVLNQGDYNEKYKALAERYGSIKKGLEGIEEKRLERSAKKASILDFIKEVEQIDEVITEFDEELWKGIIEKVVVNIEGKIAFKFKDGIGLDWNV